MYNKYRITVVVLMVVRSSRMQRTRTIAAAIKSIYYARVCYIRATYSLPLSVSFSFSLFRSHPFTLPLILTHAHSFTRSLFLSFSPSLSFSFAFSPYCKFLLIFLALPHLIFSYLHLIIIIIVIIIVSNDYYVFGRKSLLLSSFNALAKHR